MLAAVLVAIPAAVVPAVVYSEGGDSHSVKVPRLVGMTGLDAEAKVQRLGLKAFSDQSAMTPPTPPKVDANSEIHGGSLRVTVVDPAPGFVISQTPRPGVAVRPGSTVYFAVAPTRSG